MNITLTGTKIKQDTKLLAFEKNNNVDVINITVDTDESWTYKLDVKYPGCRNDKYNIINLTRVNNELSAILTSDMLPFSGKYLCQLRGINNDKVYHTDTFEVWVKYSIEPGETYNPVPSEFYQIEANITEMNIHPPYPSDDGYWMIWDTNTKQYIKSDIEAATGQGAVRYDIAQELTDEQQKQARDNIGAENQVFQITCTYDSSITRYSVDKTHAEILAAYEAGQLLVMYYDGATFIGAQNNDFGFIFTGAGHSCGIWVNELNRVGTALLQGGSKLVTFNPDDKFNLYDGNIIVSVATVTEEFVIYYNGGFYYYYNRGSSIMRFECLRTNATTGHMERSIMEIERNTTKGTEITVSDFEPIPANNNSFVIKVSPPEEPDGPLTADKTYDEIIEALNNRSQYDAIYATYYGDVLIPVDDAGTFGCNYSDIFPENFSEVVGSVIVFSEENNKLKIELYPEQTNYTLPSISETSGVPYYDVEYGGWSIKELTEPTGVFQITFTQSGITVTSDKTADEIWEAAKAGLFTFGYLNNEAYYMTNVSTSDGDIKLRKYSDPTDVLYYNNALYQWQHYTDNWNGRLVPTVTASDNGKFLRVVNGAWAAAEIQNANGEDF